MNAQGYDSVNSRMQMCSGIIIPESALSDFKAGSRGLNQALSDFQFSYLKFTPTTAKIESAPKAHERGITHYFLSTY